MSDYFSSLNGVRQGGIASPILYCVYVDELLNRLKQNGCGCWIGHHYAASLCYADDLTLLSPTVHGLQQMLQVCEEYAKDYGMFFNPVKSVCTMFTKKRINSFPSVYLCGDKLSWVQQVKHLGSILSGSLSEGPEIALKRGDLVGRTNVVVSTLHKAPDDVILEVFKTQVCHFYGAAAWDFNDPRVNDFHTMWNRCARRILGLPGRTRTRYLPHLMGTPRSKIQVYNRFLKLLHKMLKSDNIIMRHISNHGLVCKNTVIGHNLHTIDCDTALTMTTQDLFNDNVKVKDFTSVDDLCTVKAIKDLRSGEVQFDDANDFLVFLCIS